VPPTWICRRRAAPREGSYIDNDRSNSVRRRRAFIPKAAEGVRGKMTELRTCEDLTAATRAARQVMEAGERLHQEGERMEQEVERLALANGITMDDVLYPIESEGQA
jgi:hypothetical protein